MLIELVNGNIRTINGWSKNLNYNHLKIHSQYSICEGAIKIDDLKDYVKDKIQCLSLIHQIWVHLNLQKNIKTGLNQLLEHKLISDLRHNWSSSFVCIK